MRSLSFLLILSLCLPACDEQITDAGATETIPESQQVRDDSSAITYLALGDSYTIGHSVTVQERWPVILVNDLRDQKLNMAAPKIIATTGWTTSDLLTAVAGIKPSAPFDLVSLMIGVNNQYQGRSQDGYRLEFRQLLSKSIEFAGGKPAKVFVLSIPDWGVSTLAAPDDRERIAGEIDQFNNIGKDECEKAKVLFIDITGISRTALNDPSMLASDGLHFSGKMHQLWVNAVIPMIKGKVHN